jgi:hypothetical protein
VNRLRTGFNPDTLQPSDGKGDDIRLDIENHGWNLRA